jgi:hypothetical protein
MLKNDAPSEWLCFRTCAGIIGGLIFTPQTGDMGER